MHKRNYFWDEREHGPRCGGGRGEGRGRGRHHGRHKGQDHERGERGRGGRRKGGPGGFGRWGGGGRVFGPGDLRLVLLALIAEQPRHGYELIKALEEKFGGGYAPSPGSVYPTLTLLEELGQIRAKASEGAKKLFEITEEGRAYLAENQAAVVGVMDRMALAARAMRGEHAPESVHEAIHTLRAALRYHRAGWGPEESERVRQILERATKEISGEE